MRVDVPCSIFPAPVLAEIYGRLFDMAEDRSLTEQASEMSQIVSRRSGRSPAASASICERGGETKSLRSGPLLLLISLIPSRR